MSITGLRECFQSCQTASTRKAAATQASPSHHPLLAVLAEAHFVLHGWLRSGNCGSARGVVEFLKEALAFLPEGLGVRVVRADAGFFDQKLLAFLEEVRWLYTSWWPS